MGKEGKCRQLLCRDPGSKLGNEALHSSHPSALIIKVNRKYFTLRRELDNIKTFVNTKNAIFLMIPFTSTSSIWCKHPVF
jgi:hypothetical protein